MLRHIIALASLLAGSGFLMFAGGINGLILPLRGSAEGFSAFNLGLLGAAWALGYVAGCVYTPGLVQRVGHIRSFAVLAVLAALSVLVSLLYIHPLPWIVLRIVCGFSFSGAAMIVESWLSETTQEADRGKVFGSYMTINLVATTGGNLLIMAGDKTGYAMFVLAAVFYCFALLPPVLTTVKSPAPLVRAQLDLRFLWNNSHFAVIAILLVGFSNGAFGTLGAVYAERIGLSVPSVAMFMALALLAGALLQIPVGILSDRFDRRIVLSAIACVAALVEIYFVVVQPVSLTANIVAAALFGGAIYTMYPVVVAHANDRASPDSFLAISGGLLLMFGIGAIVGPVVCGIAMSLFGPVGLFAATLAAHAIIVVYGLGRVRTRTAPPEREKEAFVAGPPGRLATPETAILDPRAPEHRH